jgi:hypothetical protein
MSFFIMSYDTVFLGFNSVKYLREIALINEVNKTGIIANFIKVGVSFCHF